MNGKIVVITGALGALGNVVLETALARAARLIGVDHAKAQAAATAERIENDASSSVIGALIPVPGARVRARVVLDSPATESHALPDLAWKPRFICQSNASWKSSASPSRARSGAAISWR